MSDRIVLVKQDGEVTAYGTGEVLYIDVDAHYLDYTPEPLPLHEIPNEAKEVLWVMRERE